AAKHAKHELSGIGRATSRDNHENEPGKVGVVEIGDRTPARPLSLLLTLFAHASLPRNFSLGLVCHCDRDQAIQRWFSKAGRIGRSPLFALIDEFASEAGEASSRCRRRPTSRPLVVRGVIPATLLGAGRRRI